ncbi:hypothetical protein GIB67_019315 [Kingdonia uniflora]|uniref:histidine kinase n=1 Tax=Kingdonia uniflora TaxID=39325 RepID=A0A7J7M1H3_9MAGN|nr:hypothetical protein GIB67_019315 [Kingdonia uniflora]
MKPLRASMLEANLQRAMGVNNKGSAHNGDLPLESLENLLRGKRILLVDDNIINLKVAGGSLKKYGAEVESADNGEKAIAMLRPPHSFDACFMDIKCHFETTRRIRSIERDVNDRIRHGQESMEAYGTFRSGVYQYWR